MMYKNVEIIDGPLQGQIRDFESDRFEAYANPGTSFSQWDNMYHPIAGVLSVPKIRNDTVTYFVQKITASQSVLVKGNRYPIYFKGFRYIASLDRSAQVPSTGPYTDPKLKWDVALQYDYFDDFCGWLLERRVRTLSLTTKEERRIGPILLSALEQRLKERQFNENMVNQRHPQLSG